MIIYYIGGEKENKTHKLNYCIYKFYMRIDGPKKNIKFRVNIVFLILSS